jgi:hypothetical protein
MTGPAVDGLFVPETLGLLLLHGRFHRSVDVMVGNNAEEGLAYPFLDNNTAFEGVLQLQRFVLFSLSNQLTGG